MYKIEEIAQVIGAERKGTAEARINWLLIDSRSLCFPEETLFFALRTEKNDGHKYIEELYRRGVRNFVVEEAPLLSPQGGMNHPNVGKGIAVIYGDTHIVDGEGHFLRNRRLTPPEHLTWRSFKEGMLVCHQAFYINRQIAQPYDLTYKFSADFDWCIRCMKEGEQRGMVNHYLHEPLADYLAEGMTTANHQASLKERFRIMAKHYGLATTILQHIWFTLRVLVKR